MTTPDIQRLSAPDLPRVAALARTIWPVAFEGLIPADEIPKIVDTIYSDAQLEADMEAGHAFWIARITGRDMGFCAAFREGETIWLKKLYILPEAQGSGLGTVLTETAIRQFSPAREISLFVKNDNEKAIGFYQRSGFRVAREVPVVMGHMHFTDFVMTRPL
ncbi:MAG: GNAT family N-acetyltransferase [Hyphomonas sp.]|uniref:GNAT family N-acetyltransferase n=1 Tax=Hyphomonas sp. TaxID=87 RepID=UPI00352737C2